MIGYLSGKFIELSDQHAVVLVAGVGYEVYVGKAPCFDLPHLGESVSIWIYTYVREDQISLFGFGNPAQRRLFLQLTSISGVGPKLGYAILGQADERTLAQAIVAGDSGLLRSVPGIGKKMAERIILELGEKLSDQVGLTELPGGGGKRSSVWGDLTHALSGLGFADTRIRNVVRLLQSECASEVPALDELIKMALQKINSC